MDFDQLETFLEVARLSSFSRAAEKRFRTQPAISAQIRALEEEIGRHEDADLQAGVLTIEGARGTWLLNKHAPTRQIWLSSPLSGAPA